MNTCNPHDLNQAGRKPVKLLNIDANAKTVKGQKRGYMTAVLYLAPADSGGIQVCPMADLAGCKAGCLNTAGRGGIAKGSAIRKDNGLPDNVIQAARVNRTRFYAEDRTGFMRQLEKEVSAFIRKAARKGLTPVVRLNGTSDIRWENIRYGDSQRTIFERFQDIQWYDYTKIPNRRNLPDNYHLSLSYSEASPRYAEMISKAAAVSGLNLVKVYRTKAAKAAAMAADSAAIDGDETDLRFTDGTGTVYLYAKGRARHDRSGFVLD